MVDALIQSVKYIENIKTIYKLFSKLIEKVSGKTIEEVLDEYKKNNNKVI